MISPIDGSSDADIQGLKLAFSQSCSTINSATTSSVSEPANYRIGLQSHRNARSTERQIPTGGVWTAPDVKGKGKAHSLDWHLATMASSDRDREGPYLICSPGNILTTSLLAPPPHW